MYNYILDLAYSVYTKYCFWVWIWTIFFIKGYISVSPLPSAVLGTIFTALNSLLNPYNTSSLHRMAIFMFLELFFVALNIQKRYLITLKETILNLIVFIVYLMILHLFGLSFKQLYLSGLFKHL